MKNSFRIKSEVIISRGCPKKHIHAYLDDFTNETIQTVKQSIENSKPEENIGLFISGKKGTGKTHLLCSIVKELAERLIKIHQMYFYFITIDDLITEIKNSYDSEAKMSESELFKFYTEETDYLFLDDLGTEQITDWSLHFLDRLINRRYNDMKPTYISSNFNLKQIEKIYGGRISGRIKETSKLIQLGGKDRREKE